MLSVNQFSHDGGKASGAARQRMARVRQQQVLALHIAGLNQREIARKLEVSHRTVFRDLSEIEDAQVRVEEIIEDSGIDAQDLHITLSRMHDADISDIVENPEDPIEQLRYKPVAKWPAIWRQGLAGKVKVTPVTIPDGERTPGGDSVAYKIEIERESLLKILELSAKLKAVDALSAPTKQVETDNSVTVTVVHVGQVNVETDKA